ncbi:PREDICTED: uncharacterized protein LOC105448648 [Wasmannia auropunctata]|uniref:uncharacterized protein LOC105448648 n=1 Tax=Wasmannia auropunctata TaxID=64793 RepID=UPI0005F054D2|nr:PREDICTED: uncharacterized protein LOC105448648 [Wasmannia auropunctata]XP_011685644.1 PREDICTED: uncharacterized protein LOC105448648 [Wasmannia auropunctata]
MSYKRFLTEGITCYNGQWYCYRCKVTLQNRTEAQCHLEGPHPLSSTLICQFLQKSVKLTNKKCKKLLRHGIIIRDLDIELDYFCVHCQVPIPLECYSHHFNEENHQKHLNMSEHSSEQQSSDDNNTNNEKNNSPVENSTKRTTESNLSDTQPIREKFTKDFFVNTNTNKLEKSAGKQQNLNKNTIDNKNKTKSNLSAEIQTIREKLTKDSFANFNINGLKKPADKQRNSNNNTIANQNVPVDVSPDGNDLNRDLPSNFTAEEKSTIPLKSCNDSTQTVNETIADVPYALIQEAEMSKHFLMQHAIRYGPWYCHVCKCMLYSLTDVDRHLQEGHRNSGAQTPDFLDRSTESSNCTDLLNHEIIMQDKLQDYFCVPCRCSLPSLDHFYEHSLGKKHMRMLNCNTKFINTNINNNGLEKPTDKQRNNKIHINDNENIPVDALPVGNNGLEKPADKQRNNKIHINENQNIPVDALPDGNNGLEKPADKQRNSNNNTIENVPVDALPDGNNGLEKPANKQRNSNNKKIENASVDVLSDENNSIRNLPSSFTAEKKSTVSSKSCNKNSINILQTYKYVETAFCCLCDMFVYKTTVRNHMRESVHNYVASMLNVSDPVSHIIKLEGKKNIVTALQLNSKKFDGTVWPEYADTDAAKYTCDQCNKMIEEKDIINHEVTVHKSNMVTSMRFIHDWSPEIKNLNVTGICYPLFKCSFCNEIIHGILSLELHFSKCEHKENIKLLIDIKRREYDDSCENFQIYLEPLEFLSLISFENNGGTVRIQEQPVMYVKNHYTTLREKEKKFTYICFDCRLRFYEIHDAIIHLCTLTHLRQYKNIFHTYNYVHNVSASGELNVNESEREVKSPVSRKDASIDNASLKKRKDDEMQVNTGQHRDLNLKAEVATASSKNGGSRQNEENNSGFFMSLDVFMEIDALIKKFIPTQGTHVDFNKGSALERYNKSYEKEFLDFEEIMFTCNERKLKEIKLNLRFIHPQNLDKMLCLICNDSLLCDVQAIYEHINSKEHVTKFVKLYNDKEEFELLLDLIKPAYYQYAMCFACNTHILGRSNVDYKNHTDCSAHKKNRQRLLGQVESVLKNFENLWYSIQYFTCVDCSMRFKMKIQFMEHLNAAHRAVLTTKSNSMFDFCLTCATLWYKNESNSKDVRKSYENHCQQRMHLYLRQNNDFAITPLPQPLQKLLRDVNGIAANLFKLSNDASNDPKVTRFMDDLKRIFKTHRLPVKVYMFGSRVTGLASTNSDIDVYLNFGDGYTGPESIKRRSKQIQDCLRTDHENWDIELTLAKSRTPIIKVKHRSTGLQCDISFTSGLSVENSKFIRSFNIAYPPCQKLILFLRKWLLLGGLTGTVGIHGISNYALVWLVIFYLQVKLKKIPSIATLIQNHKQSKIVSGWEVGVSDTIFIKELEHPIHELLLGFFEFYGNFDYMHFVVCPLLGKVCQKTAFAEVSTLPDSMARYVEQLKIKKPEYFRVDSSMCVQDPFDLSHNLTKAVSISTLKRFKHYCNESFSATKVY